MRIGISSHSKNMENAIDICIQCGLRHIEVAIDNIGDWENVRECREILVNYDISVGVHMPLEINPCERISFIRNSWMDFLWINTNIGRVFDIKYYNFHLGYGVSDHVHRDRRAYLENAVDFLSNIRRMTKESVMCIENMYKSPGYMLNIGTSADDFEYIFKKVAGVGFCFDTGHNMITGDDYIERFSQNTIVAHINSNDGKNDLHNGIANISTKEYEEISRLIRLKNLEYVVLEVKKEHIEESCKKIVDMIIG